MQHAAAALLLVGSLSLSAGVATNPQDVVCFSSSSISWPPPVRTTARLPQSPVQRYEGAAARYARLRRRGQESTSMCAERADPAVAALGAAAERALSADNLSRLRREYLRQGWVAIPGFLPPHLCGPFLEEVCCTVCLCVYCVCSMCVSLTPCMCVRKFVSCMCTSVDLLISVFRLLKRCAALCVCMCIVCVLYVYCVCIVCVFRCI